MIGMSNYAIIMSRKVKFYSSSLKLLRSRTKINLFKGSSFNAKKSLITYRSIVIVVTFENIDIFPVKNKP